MKITHLVENLNRGGLERVVVDLVKAQHAAGHGCQVICLFERGLLADELDACGIRVHACGKRDGLDLRALSAARRLLRAHGTEVLHTHNTIPHYYGVVASLGLGIGRVVTTRHGMGSRDAISRREWLFNRSLWRTDRVVTVCEMAKRDLIERGVMRERILTAVPNGIPVESVAPASAAAHARLVDMLGLASGTRLIGSVGRLNWAKDQATLIRAFRRSHARHPDTALVLIGDGALRGELEAVAVGEGVADAVHFLGDRDDVHALLGGLDVFALASVTEGYSIALLEACAAALPIVATRVGGNAEIVRDGVNGYLVDAGDPDAFAERLERLLVDPALAQRLGKAGRDWVSAHGSVEAMLQQYMAIYRATR